MYLVDCKKMGCFILRLKSMHAYDYEVIDIDRVYFYKNGE